MTLEDISDVLLLTAEVVEAPHWTTLDYEHILLPPPPTPAPPDFLSRWSGVVASGSRVAGFAVASWLREEAAAEIEGLVVDQKYRRQGAGSALIRACMAWAANTGASNMRLEVRASNTTALAFYQRHGFSAVAQRRAYYSAPVEDAMLLQAPLGSQGTT